MKIMKFLSLDSIIATTLVFFILIFFPIIFDFDFLDPIQNTIQDLDVTDIVFSKIRDESNVPFDSTIILVNIAPTRKDIARQIENINKFHPAVVGFDSFFRALKGKELDNAIELAFSKIKNLVLVSQLIYNKSTKEFDTLLTSHKRFNQYAKTGFANFVLSEEQFRTVRTFSVKESYKDSIEYSFPAQISKIYSPEKFEKFIQRKIDNEIINFKRNISKYKTIDYLQSLDSTADFSFVKDKIVLFGFLGPDIKTLSSEDIFFTPMNIQYVGKSYPDMYGVVVHANIISMIMEEDFINTVPEWISITLLILIIYSLMSQIGRASCRERV